MLDDSKPVMNNSGTYGANDRSCAGGMPESERVFRRLKSVKDGRVKLTQRIRKEKAPFDATAWYLYQVKRHKEIAIREIFSKKDLGFGVEVYVAAQVNRKKKSKDTNPYQEKVVIHNKIFVRVDEAHRVDVMKECPYIIRCVTERSSFLSKNDPQESIPFVRIPDKQIQCVRKILDMADGIVEYSEHIPEEHDNIQVIGGQLLKGTLFKDIKGKVLMTNGRKEAIVILDGIGSLKFKLPIEDIAKVRKKDN